MHSWADAFFQFSAAMPEHIKTTEASLANTLSAIDIYIEHEQRENAAFSKKLHDSADALEKLTLSAAAVLESAQTVREKLSSSCAALEAAEHAESMLKDVQENFASLAGRDSLEKEKHIQRILDRLLSIAHQCEHIQTFPKPYRDIISLYSIKIESVFGLLPRQQLQIASAPDKPASEENTSEKSIVEEILNAKPDIHYWSNFFKS